MRSPLIIEIGLAVNIQHHIGLYSMHIIDLTMGNWDDQFTIYWSWVALWLIFGSDQK